ncbi:hypothetical protein GCM10023082_30480 [Streptomyces tremellae]|uniref:Uncharacterized protein n=1 Tax=Streptomyces tremellae TaxID=1124239 RepID=A0ABP7F3D4_9ACTN
MSGTADWMRAGGARERIDLKTHQPHPVRVYDFPLGGHDQLRARPADGSRGVRNAADGRAERPRSACPVTPGRP